MPRANLMLHITRHPPEPAPLAAIPAVSQHQTTVFALLATGGSGGSWKDSRGKKVEKINASTFTSTFPLLSMLCTNTKPTARSSSSEPYDHEHHSNHRQVQLVIGVAHLPPERVSALRIDLRQGRRRPLLGG